MKLSGNNELRGNYTCNFNFSFLKIKTCLSVFFCLFIGGILFERNYFSMYRTVSILYQSCRCHLYNLFLRFLDIMGCVYVSSPNRGSSSGLFIRQVSVGLVVPAEPDTAYGNAPLRQPGPLCVGSQDEIR